MTMTRRAFTGLAGQSLLLPFTSSLGAATTPSAPLFRIRTITAGITLRSARDHEAIEKAAHFLGSARARYEAEGHEVQTVRIATQPLTRFLPDWDSDRAFDLLRSLDRLAKELGFILALGPVIEDDQSAQHLAPFGARLVTETSRLNFSATVASAKGGIHRKTILAAAETVAALAAVGEKGQENFRFAAAAQVPPGSPFFPGAWHEGPANFALGLESANLLTAVFRSAATPEAARISLIEALDTSFAGLADTATSLAAEHGRAYLGIDTSPAPGLDASIGSAIERLSGVPFGAPSTLAACAVITDALKGVKTRSCGLSGLMLPVLEDPVLAQRASEGRFDSARLLLFSSVCATGLDMVPLPGNIGTPKLARIILDVAALATKYRKPLLARLLPIPGKDAGDDVTFDNPLLANSRVLYP
ncbi:MAG: DUF711 family protein [Gammaproteobacteria bacterium]|nr:DUF711 family protein [Gammaproteobacteria bacterium]